MTAIKAEPSLQGWLASLAAKTPSPGGGGAAAIEAAIAAALASMVANYTTGPRWKDRETVMREIQARSELRVELALGLAKEDEIAFLAVGDAYALPKSSEPEQEVRRNAIESALTGAAIPPSRVGTLAADLLEDLWILATNGNTNVVSDVAVAALSARSAIDAAIVNIVVNARLIKALAEKERLLSEVDDLTRKSTEAQDLALNVLSRLKL